MNRIGSLRSIKLTGTFVTKAIKVLAVKHTRETTDKLATYTQQVYIY